MLGPDAAIPTHILTHTVGRSPIRHLRLCAPRRVPQSDTEPGTHGYRRDLDPVVLHHQAA